LKIENFNVQNTYSLYSTIILKYRPIKCPAGKAGRISQ
jgi:hypothetical protein